MKKIIWILVIIMLALLVWLLARGCMEKVPNTGDTKPIITIDTSDIGEVIEELDKPDPEIPRPPYEIFFLDQLDRPLDKGTKGTSYTAKVYILDNTKKVLVGPYRGSTFPNSISNTNNSTNSNTAMINTEVQEVYVFNNLYGHKGGTVKGLNLIDAKQFRTTPGYDPEIVFITMECVNVHTGASDNGNHNSRGSRGCMTIHPDDVDAFFANFNFDGGTKGTSSGVISVVRSIPFIIDQMTNDLQDVY